MKQGSAWRAYCDLLWMWQVQEKLSSQAIISRAEYMVQVTCGAHPGERHYEQLSEYLRSLIDLLYPAEDGENEHYQRINPNW